MVSGLQTHFSFSSFRSLNLIRHCGSASRRLWVPGAFRFCSRAPDAGRHRLQGEARSGEHAGQARRQGNRGRDRRARAGVRDHHRGAGPLVDVDHPSARRAPRGDLHLEGGGLGQSHGPRHHGCDHWRGRDLGRRHCHHLFRRAHDRKGRAHLQAVRPPCRTSSPGAR